VFARKRGCEDRLTPGCALLFTLLSFGLYLAGLKLLGKTLPFGPALVAAQGGLLLVPALLWARQAGCRWKDAFGLRAPSRRGWARTLPWLLLIPAFQEGADLLMTWGFPVEAPGFAAEQAKLLLGLSGRIGLVATVAVFALTPALCEELVFRGLVLRGLARARSRWVPLLGSALLFGAFHVQPMQAIPAAVIGVLLAHVALQSRSILPGMALHFGVNALAVLAVVQGGPLVGSSWALLLAGLGLAGLAAGAVDPVRLWLSRDRVPGSGSSPAR
jgi:sodium transport system permease protein